MDANAVTVETVDRWIWESSSEVRPVFLEQVSYRYGFLRSAMAAAVEDPERWERIRQDLIRLAREGKR
jgi:hypothetical protein